MLTSVHLSSRQGPACSALRCAPPFQLRLRISCVSVKYVSRPRQKGVKCLAWARGSQKDRSLQTQLDAVNALRFLAIDGEPSLHVSHQEIHARCPAGRADTQRSDLVMVCVARLHDLIATSASLWSHMLHFLAKGHAISASLHRKGIRSNVPPRNLWLPSKTEQNINTSQAYSSKQA